MISTAAINKYAKYMESAKAKLARIREKGEETVGTALVYVESGAAAFGFSYFNGKSGDLTPDNVTELQLMGVPADLLTFVGVGGISLLGGLGKYGEHGRNVAAGALGSFLSRQGMIMGAKARTEPAKPAQGFHLFGQPSSLNAGAPTYGAPTVSGVPRHAGSFGYG